LDSTGALYGTTEFGGDNGYGTVFELTYSGGGWVETVLHSFGGSGDGQNPLGAVIETRRATSMVRRRSVAHTATEPCSR